MLLAIVYLSTTSTAAALYLALLAPVYAPNSGKSSYQQQKTRRLERFFLVIDEYI